MDNSNTAVSSPSLASSRIVGIGNQAIVVKPPGAGRDFDGWLMSKSTPGVAVPLMKRACTTTSLVPV